MTRPGSRPAASFPGAAGETTRLLSADLGERGFALRPACDADLPFLRQLHRELHAEELAPLGWPAAAQAAFADGQFALQHAHYLDHYRGADFLLIEQHDDPVGRYYLLREAPDYLVVDISLCADARGRGLGSALIAHTQRQAGQHGCGVRLHVRHDNAGAQRLYQRLGFAVADDHGAYLSMRWRPS